MNDFEDKEDEVKWTLQDKDKERHAEVLLAYRNDIEPHWYMALIEHEESQKPKKKKNPYMNMFYGGDSDDVGFALGPILVKPLTLLMQCDNRCCMTTYVD